MIKENIDYGNTTNQFICRDTGFRLNGELETKPKDMKVSIWGYELCSGAEWNDFLDVVNKLGKEKTDLEAKLADIEENHHKNIVELTKIATEKDRKIEQLKQQLTVMQYAEKYNLKSDRIYHRLKKGWCLEDALHKPVRSYKGYNK